MKKTIIILMLFYANMFSQTYLNLSLSDNTNLTIEVSELDKITFSGGNVLFTLTNAQVYTVAMSDVSTFGASPTSNGGSPLPVELISFTAENSEQGILLKWQTATEVNNYGFEIQRSVISGQQSDEWETLGFVPGHGNSNSPKNYEFIDDLSSLPEQSRMDSLKYRLKQIDTDGGFAYYATIAELDFNITDVQDHEVIPTQYELYQNYPNPFNPTTTIKYAIPNVETLHATSLQNVSLKVYDMLGCEVTMLVNEKQAPGYYEVEFNGSSLSSGVYFYRLETSSGFVMNKKLMLLK